jgi:hypothetical protein
MDEHNVGTSKVDDAFNLGDDRIAAPKEPHPTIHHYASRQIPAEV